VEEPATPGYRRKGRRAHGLDRTGTEEDWRAGTGGIWRWVVGSGGAVANLHVRRCAGVKSPKFHWHATSQQKLP
jgi:hypothetical protein